MKILHLIDIPWWSGLSAYAFDCMNAQVSMGHDVLLLCERNSLPHKKSLRLGIKTLTMRGRKPWQQPCNFIKIGEAIFREKPDRLVAHTGSTHWMACFWGKLRGIPVLRTRAIAQPVKPHFFNNLVYQSTQWIVTASANLQKDCRLRLPDHLKDRIVVLAPPVENPDLLSPVPLKSVLPQNQKIGVLARLDPKKGHRDILKAFQILQKDVPACELHIAGAEENLPWSEMICEAEILKVRNVFYHGFLAFDEIWDFMKGCFMGVIGSLESEEVSRALLEWMASGRPVAATRVGCIPEILEDGVGGFLLDPGNPVVLAEKIYNIMKDRSGAQRMAMHNLETVSGNCAPASFKSGWRKILHA